MVEADHLQSILAKKNLVFLVDSELTMNHKHPMGTKKGYSILRSKKSIFSS